jgi:regulator of protease activity HflC (stomatin/prohibitin superfamily)
MIVVGRSIREGRRRCPRGRLTMMNIGFFKGLPTDYVMKYSSGRLVREGAGLAFWYLQHNTQVVAVPTSSMDANFVFNEVTNNFQDVTIQGQFTYRIHAPKQAAALLNFTLNLNKRSYVSNDPDLLSQRITNIIQMETRGELQKVSLEEALGRYEAIAATVHRRIKEGALLESLGVELLSVYFVSAKPTPEVAKALEAEYRETLLRKADEAIYARRAAAVEEERKIKENELNTDIALEERKRQLIDLQGDNERRQAENRGQAIELEAQYKAKAKQMELGVYAGLEPRTVLALALNELGQNAGQIGNLTITSEILASLLNGDRSKD